MSAWGVGATSALLLLLHGREIARGTLAPLGGFGAAAPWIVVASIAAADLSMTVFCTAAGLTWCLPAEATAPLHPPSPTRTRARARARARFSAGPGRPCSPRSAAQAA